MFGFYVVINFLKLCSNYMFYYYLINLYDLFLYDLLSCNLILYKIYYYVTLSAVQYELNLLPLLFSHQKLKLPTENKSWLQY